MFKNNCLVRRNICIIYYVLKYTCIFNCFQCFDAHCVDSIQMINTPAVMKVICQSLVLEDILYRVIEFYFLSDLYFQYVMKLNNINPSLHTTGCLILSVTSVILRANIISTALLCCWPLTSFWKWTDNEQTAWWVQQKRQVVNNQYNTETKESNVSGY